MTDLSKTPLEDLTDICETMFERWDADQRAGKLLMALMGELNKYDPRVTRIRQILSRHGDFGKSYAYHEGVELSCNNVAPGLTMQDLSRVFHEAKAKAEPGDELAGDPGRWPDNRGIMAVVETINAAYRGEKK